MKNVRDVVCIAVFKEKKVLVVNTKFSGELYYFLGGTRETDETDIECLMREVKEEANVEVDSNSLIFLRTFEAEAHGRKNTTVQMHLYNGSLIGKPKPSNEITRIQFINSTIKDTLKTPLAHIVLNWLKDKNYID